MSYHADLDQQRRKGGPAVVLAAPGRHAVVICDDAARFWALMTPDTDFAGLLAIAVEAFDDALRFDLRHGLI